MIQKMKNHFKEPVNRFLLIVAVMLFTVALIGCSQADIASANVSKQADSFNVLRQLTVINNITNDTMMTMTGKFSITVDSVDSQLEVIVENEDGSYAKHFVSLNPVTSYTVVDLDTNYVDKYNFTVNYNPKMWFPIGLENID